MLCSSTVFSTIHSADGACLHHQELDLVFVLAAAGHIRSMVAVTYEEGFQCDRREGFRRLEG